MCQKTVYRGGGVSSQLTGEAVYRSSSFIYCRCCGAIHLSSVGRLLSSNSTVQTRECACWYVRGVVFFFLDISSRFLFMPPPPPPAIYSSIVVYFIRSPGVKARFLYCSRFTPGTPLAGLPQKKRACRFSLYVFSFVRIL